MIILGRRPGTAICDETYIWAKEPNLTSFMYILRMTHYVFCICSKSFFYFVLLSIPEAILYPMTFHQMIKLTNTKGLSGALKSDTIKRRNQQNTMNIRVTFFAWLAQFFTNMVDFTMLHAFYGQHIFLHGLFALLHLSLNFRHSIHKTLEL